MISHGANVSFAQLRTFDFRPPKSKNGMSNFKEPAATWLSPLPMQLALI